MCVAPERESVAMATTKATKNAVNTNAEVITSIAALGNKYHNVRIAKNQYDVKCIVIDNFAPQVNSEEKGTAFVPVSIIISLLNSDVKAQMLILALAKKLANLAGKGVGLNDTIENATRTILGSLRIKANFDLRVAGQIFTKEDGTEGAYTSDWYQLDTDSIRLSFGEAKEAYQNCDPDYFIADSAIEDF